MLRCAAKVQCIVLFLDNLLLLQDKSSPQASLERRLSAQSDGQEKCAENIDSWINAQSGITCAQAYFPDRYFTISKGIFNFI